MQSIKSLSKKKRRFSQQQISTQQIPLKNYDSIGRVAVQKFKKVQHQNFQNRKSMELQKTSKCELNLDFMKRTTDWSKGQLDTIEFQKIIQKRKQINRFKFKTIDIKSIQHRSNNSLVEQFHVERIKSLVDFQIKHEKKFSLEKQSIEFFQLEKEFKDLNDMEVEEKAKNKVMAQLIALLSYETSKPDENEINQRNLSLSEKYSKEIRKEQKKTDLFIRLSNDIKEKIMNCKKEIFSYRSQRVVYSSIFKEVQRQIKLAQNCYKHILINSMAFFQTFCLSRLDFHAKQYSSQADKPQSGLNNFNQYNSIFSTMFKANGVKFIGTPNSNEEELLNDRINSNTAINYYLKSRKVIILPRYKEHYQSSRKKIKIQSETLSYEQLSNQINRLFQALNINLDHNLELVVSIDYMPQHKKIDKSLNNNNFYKNNHQNPQSPKTNTHLEPNYSRTSANFQLFAQTQIQKVKKLINQLPTQNQTLFNEIQKVDFLIDKTTSQINQEQQKSLILQTSLSPYLATSKSFDTPEKTNGQELLWQKQLQTIQNLLGISAQDISEKRLISVLQKLEEFQITTKTACLFDKAQPIPTNTEDHEKASPSKLRSSGMATDRSNISISLKKRDTNVGSPGKRQQMTEKNITKTKKDLLCRSPQNLNSILKNIKVYESYERAFQRMDFQKEYQLEKNRKKRTLIRRDGMVSLCVLKTEEKTKLVKRQSSNKKQQQNQR